MENTKIEWCDHTFNPWIGCTKVSPGCAGCYACAHDHRWGHDSWGPGKLRRRTSLSNWHEPLRWNRDAAAPLARPRVFCASLADWLDDEVPIEWLADLLNLIRLTPNLDWLLLTKRPQNWRTRVSAACDNLMERHIDHFEMFRWLYSGTPPTNVWIGTSVEDQTRADERIPELLKIPAKVRFLSCEPLLGPVDLTTIIKDGIGRDALRVNESSMGDPERHIDWVIAGGESGPGARPMHPDWARSLRDQCQAAGVPFLFKQWGEWLPQGQLMDISHCSKITRSLRDIGGAQVVNVGKAAAGRLLDGVEYNGFPEVAE